MPIACRVILFPQGKVRNGSIIASIICPSVSVACIAVALALPPSTGSLILGWHVNANFEFKPTN